MPSSSRPSSASNALQRAIHYVSSLDHQADEYADISIRSAAPALTKQPDDTVSANSSIIAASEAASSSLHHHQSDVAADVSVASVSNGPMRRQSLLRRKIVRGWTVADVRHHISEHSAFLNFSAMIPNDGRSCVSDELTAAPHEESQQQQHQQQLLTRPLKRVHIADAFMWHQLDGNGLIDLTQDDVMNHLHIRHLGTAKGLLRAISTLLDPTIPINGDGIDTSGSHDQALAAAAAPLSGGAVAAVAPHAHDATVIEEEVRAATRQQYLFKHFGADAIEVSPQRQQRQRPQTAVARLNYSSLSPYKGWEEQLGDHERARVNPRPGSASYRLSAALEQRKAKLQAWDDDVSKSSASQQQEEPPQPTSLKVTSTKKKTSRTDSPPKKATIAPATMQDEDIVVPEVARAIAMERVISVDAGLVEGPKADVAHAPTNSNTGVQYQAGILEKDRRRESFAVLHVQLLLSMPDGVGLGWLIETTGRALEWDRSAVEAMKRHHSAQVAQSRKEERRKKKELRRLNRKEKRKNSATLKKTLHQMDVDAEIPEDEDDADDAAIEAALEAAPHRKVSTNTVGSTSSEKRGLSPIHSSRPPSALKTPNESRPLSAPGIPPKSVSIVSPTTSGVYVADQALDDVGGMDSGRNSPQPTGGLSSGRPPSGGSSRSKNSPVLDLAAPPDQALASENPTEVPESILTELEFIDVLSQIARFQTPAQFDHMYEFIDTFYGEERIEQSRRMVSSRQLFQRWDEGNDGRGYIPTGQFLRVLSRHKKKAIEEYNTAQRNAPSGTAAPLKELKPTVAEGWSEDVHPELDDSDEVKLFVLPQLSIHKRRPLSASKRSRSQSYVSNTSFNSVSTVRSTGPPMSRMAIIFDEECFVSYLMDELIDDNAESFDAIILNLRTLVDEMLAQRRGLAASRMASEVLTDVYLAKTSSTRPLLLMHSAVVDPVTTVETIFSRAKKHQGVSSRRSSVESTGSASTAAPPSARQLPSRKLPTPPKTQKKLHIFSVGSSSSEEEAMRCIERDGMRNGHWIILAFPPETIDRPVDTNRTLNLHHLSEDDAASAFGLGAGSSSMSDVSSVYSWSTFASSSGGGSGGGGSFTGRMNACLRRMARLIASTHSFLIHKKFRVFCHCPIDFVDAQNIPQIAKAHGVVVPLLIEEDDMSKALENAAQTRFVESKVEQSLLQDDVDTTSADPNSTSNVPARIVVEELVERVLQRNEPAEASVARSLVREVMGCALTTSAVHHHQEHSILADHEPDADIEDPVHPGRGLHHTISPQRASRQSRPSGIDASAITMCDNSDVVSVEVTPLKGEHSAELL